MPRPRSSSSRRRPPAGPSKSEQRKAAATAFEPVLAAVEPLARRAVESFPLTLPSGFPWFDRSDREFTVHLAPAWSWSVSVRYRDQDEATMQIIADQGGVEQIEPLNAGTSDVLPQVLSAHLSRFVQTAQASNLRVQADDAGD